MRGTASERCCAYPSIFGRAEEDLVPVVRETPVGVLHLAALGDRQEIVVAARGTHIEEISAAFAGPYALREHAFFVFAITVPLPAPKVSAAVPKSTAVAVVATIAGIPAIPVPKISLVSPLKMPVFHLSCVLFKIDVRISSEQRYIFR